MSATNNDIEAKAVDRHAPQSLTSRSWAGRQLAHLMMNRRVAREWLSLGGVLGNEPQRSCEHASGLTCFGCFQILLCNIGRKFTTCKGNYGFSSPESTCAFPLSPGTGAITSRLWQRYPEAGFRDEDFYPATILMLVIIIIIIIIPVDFIRKGWWCIRSWILLNKFARWLASRSISAQCACCLEVCPVLLWKPETL